MNVFILGRSCLALCTLCEHFECLFYLIKYLKALGNIKVADWHKDLWTEDMKMTNYRIMEWTPNQKYKLYTYKQKFYLKTEKCNWKWELFKQKYWICISNELKLTWKRNCEHLSILWIYTCQMYAILVCNYYELVERHIFH